MRRKYTLPLAICPTIHNRERPFLMRVCSRELFNCVFYHKLVGASTCRLRVVWINLPHRYSIGPLMNRIALIQQNACR